MATSEAKKGAAIQFSAVDGASLPPEVLAAVQREVERMSARTAPRQGPLKVIIQKEDTVSKVEPIGPKGPTSSDSGPSTKTKTANDTIEFGECSSETLHSVSTILDSGARNACQDSSDLSTKMSIEESVESKTETQIRPSEILMRQTSLVSGGKSRPRRLISKPKRFENCDPILKPLRVDADCVEDVKAHGNASVLSSKAHANVSDRSSKAHADASDMNAMFENKVSVQINCVDETTHTTTSDKLTVNISSEEEYVNCAENTSVLGKTPTNNLGIRKEKTTPRRKRVDQESKGRQEVLCDGAIEDGADKSKGNDSTKRKRGRPRREQTTIRADHSGTNAVRRTIIGTLSATCEGSQSEKRDILNVVSKTATPDGGTAKRTRGRPRKEFRDQRDTEGATQATEGKSPEMTGHVQHDMVNLKHQREVSPDAGVRKTRRGRPRKDVTITIKLLPSDDIPTPAKRKRGRPCKDSGSQKLKSKVYNAGYPDDTLENEEFIFNEDKSLSRQDSNYEKEMTSDISEQQGRNLCSSVGQIQGFMVDKNVEAELACESTSSITGLMNNQDTQRRSPSGTTFDLRTRTRTVIKEEPNIKVEELSETYLSSAKATQQNSTFGKASVKCNLCRTVFESPAVRREHQITCTVPCEICGKIFDKRYELDRHMSSKFGCGSAKKAYLLKQGKNIYSCELCGVFLGSMIALNRHLRDHESRPSAEAMQCNLCKMQFKSKAGIEKHQKLCEKLTCPYCGEHLKHRYLLERHTKTGVCRTYKMSQHETVCNICGKELSDYRKLKEHKFIHEVDNKFPCSLCEKSFKSALKLSYHVRVTHQRSRAALCTLCGKSFLNVEGLNYHMKSHAEAQLKDEYVHLFGVLCGQGFKCAMVEPLNGMYSCFICLRTFAKTFDWYYHLKMHLQSDDFDDTTIPDKIKEIAGSTVAKYAEEFQKRAHPCTVCHQVLFKPSQLVHHLEKHKLLGHDLESSDPSNRTRLPAKFECTECSCAFRCKQSLIVHKQYHDQNFDFSCDECGMGFPLQKRLDIHRYKAHGLQSKGVIVCAKCDRVFFNQKIYLKHVKVVHDCERPYQCNICCKTFGSKYAMDIHGRIHTKYRPHKCPSCLKTFTDRSNLLQHTKRAHPDINITSTSRMMIQAPEKKHVPMKGTKAKAAKVPSVRAVDPRIIRLAKKSNPESVAGIRANPETRARVPQSGDGCAQSASEGKNQLVSKLREVVHLSSTEEKTPDTRKYFLIVGKTEDVQTEQDTEWDVPKDTSINETPELITGHEFANPDQHSDQPSETARAFELVNTRSDLPQLQETIYAQEDTVASYQSHVAHPAGRNEPQIQEVYLPANQLEINKIAYTQEETPNIYVANHYQNQDRVPKAEDSQLYASSDPLQTDSNAKTRMSHFQEMHPSDHQAQELYTENGQPGNQQTYGVESFEQVQGGACPVQGPPQEMYIITNQQQVQDTMCTQQAYYSLGGQHPLEPQGSGLSSVQGEPFLTESVDHPQGFKEESPSRQYGQVGETGQHSEAMGDETFVVLDMNHHGGHVADLGEFGTEVVEVVLRSDGQHIHS